MDPLLAGNLTLPMRPYLTHSYVTLMVSTTVFIAFSYPKLAPNCSLLYLLFLINSFYFCPVPYLTFLVILQITYVPTHMGFTHCTQTNTSPRLNCRTQDAQMDPVLVPGRSNQTSLICPIYPQYSSEEFQNS